VIDVMIGIGEGLDLEIDPTSDDLDQETENVTETLPLAIPQNENENENPIHQGNPENSRRKHQETRRPETRVNSSKREKPRKGQTDQGNVNLQNQTENPSQNPNVKRNLLTMTILILTPSK